MKMHFNGVRYMKQWHIYMKQWHSHVFNIGEMTWDSAEKGGGGVKFSIFTSLGQLIKLMFRISKCIKFVTAAIPPSHVYVLCFLHRSLKIHEFRWRCYHFASCIYVTHKKNQFDRFCCLWSFGLFVNDNYSSRTELFDNWGVRG